MGVVEQPLLLFLALFALYSPLAAVSSYFPVVARLRPADQGRLRWACSSTSRSSP